MYAGNGYGLANQQLLAPMAKLMGKELLSDAHLERISNQSDSVSLLTDYEAFFCNQAQSIEGSFF
ncbi:hypothetical protein GCM10027423_64530 [Spirosoma arcticum]